MLEEVQLVLDIFTPTDLIEGGLGMGAALNRDTLARIADLGLHLSILVEAVGL